MQTSLLGSFNLPKLLGPFKNVFLQTLLFFKLCFKPILSSRCEQVDVSAMRIPQVLELQMQ